MLLPGPREFEKKIQNLCSGKNVQNFILKYHRWESLGMDLIPPAFYPSRYLASGSQKETFSNDGMRMRKGSSFTFFF